MRRTSNLLPRSSRLAAVLVLAVGCGSATAMSQPLGLCKLTGDAAAWLLDEYDPPAPVIVAGVDGEPRTILLARNTTAAADLPGDLFSTASVEGCDPDDGITCCDATKGASGEMVVGATYETEIGWVQTGEFCEAPAAMQGVEYDPIPSWVFRELNAQCGVNHCFMEITNKHDEPVVLVNAEQGSPIWNYCMMQVADAGDSPRILAQAPARGGGGAPWLRSSNMQRMVLGAKSLFIPATHVKAPPPPPRCQSAAPTFCNSSGTTYKRCPPDVRHWYKKNGSTGEWCQLSSRCGC